MKEIENIIRTIVRDEVASLDVQAGGDPVLIDIEDTAKMVGLNRVVIDNLVREAPANGFPAIRISPRRIVIDKTRFLKWLNAGGLLATEEETVTAKGPGLRLAS